MVELGRRLGLLGVRFHGGVVHRLSIPYFLVDSFNFTVDFGYNRDFYRQLEQLVFWCVQILPQGVVDVLRQQQACCIHTGDMLGMTIEARRMVSDRLLDLCHPGLVAARLCSQVLIGMGEL